jgi:hypothetical protein
MKIKRQLFITLQIYLKQNTREQLEPAQKVRFPILMEEKECGESTSFLTTRLLVLFVITWPICVLLSALEICAQRLFFFLSPRRLLIAELE